MLRPARRRRAVRTALGVAALAAVLALAPGVATRVWAAGRLPAEAAAPQRPVGLLLGAAVQPGGVPSAFLQARIDVAARLWHAGRLRAIIVSGNREPFYDEPRAMRAGLVAAGVPADVIIDDPAGFDTYDSCVRARDVYGVDKLTLISQTFHLPRAVTTCKLVGVDAIGVGDDSVRQGSITWWYGEAREFGAAWKMLADVVTARQPRQDAPDDSVARILRRG
ncbi:SanA/YdcF family protein [Naumannella huperziae]